jgi:L-lactate dehydrogenase
VLDSLRFRSLLGEELDVDPSRLEAMVIGEHGDSMVPVISTLRWEGKPISELPSYSGEALRRAVEATRTAGAECIRLKGGAGYAVGLAVREVVAAILGDARVVLPVSTLQESGELRGTALSRPTRLGRSGRLAHEELALSQDEHLALLRSAEALRQTIALLQTGSAAA